LRRYLKEKARLQSKNPRIRLWGCITLTTWHALSATAVTSSASGCCSVGIIRSRTQATEFNFRHYERLSIVLILQY
jgi:hypothetical protein